MLNNPHGEQLYSPDVYMFNQRFKKYVLGHLPLHILTLISCPGATDFSTVATGWHLEADSYPCRVFSDYFRSFHSHLWSWKRFFFFDGVRGESHRSLSGTSQMRVNVGEQVRKCVSACEFKGDHKHPVKSLTAASPTPSRNCQHCQ